MSASQFALTGIAVTLHRSIIHGPADALVIDRIPNHAPYPLGLDSVAPKGGQPQGLRHTCVAALDSSAFGCMTGCSEGGCEHEYANSRHGPRQAKRS